MDCTRTPAILTALALAVAFAYACDSKSNDTPNGSSSSSGSSGGAHADGGDVPIDAAVLLAGRDIVFNEFDAVGGNEWFEIANKGTTEVDLSDHALADTDKVTGKPKADDAMKFPAGTKLAAGARLVVIGSKKKGDPVGPHPKAECLVDRGPETCLWATFGISATTGESVHFLAPNGAVITSTVYPTALAPDASAGRTVCRLPDLTGELASCASTPGEANAP